MALSPTSTFPTTLDTITDPEASTKTNATGYEHSNLHQRLNDAIEKIEAKVGVDSSDVTTSIDYKLSSTATYAFSATSSIAQTITASSYPDMVWTKMAFATEEYDYGSCYASNKFTAAVNGVYRFTASVSAFTSSAEALVIALYKNGTIIKCGNICRNVADWKTVVPITATVSADILLAATDYVEVYVENISNSDEATDGTAVGNYFSGYIISL